LTPIFISGGGASSGLLGHQLRQPHPAVGDREVLVACGGGFLGLQEHVRGVLRGVDGADGIRPCTERHAVEPS
jgi:hypothetical protein